MGSIQGKILESINLSKLQYLFYWNGKGRPPYDRVAMITALLLMRLFPSIESYEDLEWFLARYPFWAAKCGFNWKKKTPDSTTLCKFANSLDDRKLGKINEILVSELIRLGLIKANYWSMDSTIIEALPGDKEARWGHKDEDTLLFGYRIQMIVCAESELPLMTLVTPANEVDFSWGIPVMSRTLATFRKLPLYVIADKGYDSAAIRRYIRDISWRTKDIIPQREFTDVKPIYSDAWNTVYRMRTTAERLWSRFKKVLHLEQIKVSGLRRVTRLVTFIQICVLVVALTAYVRGRKADYRRIKSFKKLI